MQKTGFPPHQSKTKRQPPAPVPRSQMPRRRRPGLTRHRPARLADIHGQAAIVRSLFAFAAAPQSNAFIFAGSSGVGKTAAAWAPANELGCDRDWGGVIEIPSGTQDGRAVEDLLRRMHLRPKGGSGWKVVIINEADRMTPQAEVMWLDGLRMEKAPRQDRRHLHHQQPSQAHRPLRPPLRSPAVRRHQRRGSATAWSTSFAKSGSKTRLRTV